MNALVKRKQYDWKKSTVLLVASAFLAVDPAVEKDYTTLETLPAVMSEPSNDVIYSSSATNHHPQMWSAGTSDFDNVW